jgi:hypothetical protein
VRPIELPACLTKPVTFKKNPSSGWQVQLLGGCDGLTNLQQLASAAPMSKAGWQVGVRGSGRGLGSREEGLEPTHKNTALLS